MRVAVIGGGVIGLLCAHHLARRGAEVEVIERSEIGSGCSAGNAGWITPSIAVPLPAPGLRLKSLAWMLSRESPLYIRPAAAPRMTGWLLSFWRHCNRRDFDRGTRAFAALGAQTMELFDQLSEDGIAYEGATPGLLMVFRDPEEMEEERALVEACGYAAPAELAKEELRELEPALAADLICGLRVPSERTVRPETLCAGVGQALEAAGVEIHERSVVTGLEVEGRRARAVRIENGQDLEADAFVIATGAEAAALARECGAPLPLQAGKGYSVTVERPRLEVRNPLYLGEAKIGITPFEGSLRIAGTMELSGINLNLDRRRLEALTSAAERHLPGALEGDGHESWVGMRPITPDGLPILGRMPASDNVYVATGHQMLGVTLAPSTGKVMAELILDGESSVDLAPFSPARFGG